MKKSLQFPLIAFVLRFQILFYLHRWKYKYSSNTFQSSKNFWKQSLRFLETSKYESFSFFFVLSSQNTLFSSVETNDSSNTFQNSFIFVIVLKQKFLKANLWDFLKLIQKILGFPSLIFKNTLLKCSKYLWKYIILSGFRRVLIKMYQELLPLLPILSLLENTFFWKIIVKLRTKYFELKQKSFEGKFKIKSI